MRILVTGVTGQVGSALVPRLHGLGTVMPADREVLDLAKPRQIAAGLDRLQPDLIVNPAAYTAVDQAEDENELAFTVNAESPAAIARWAAMRGVPLVHLSTDYVFDGSGERPWEENDVPKPLSAYGASKLAGEVAVRAAGGPHLVVRTSWVYAASGRNFLRTIARLAGEHSELKIVADQVGAPTAAAVIADAFVHILAGNAHTLPARFSAAGGLVHLAAAGTTSWHGFATAIVEGLRSRHVAVRTNRIIAIRTEEYPTKAARPRNCRLALGRLAQVFGIITPKWSAALVPELDLLAGMLRTGNPAHPVP
jgi:dTDP-4-dehydrorhamnose reductase